METYLVKAYPGYSYLESVDEVNWPLWLLSFLIGLAIFCCIIYIFLKKEDIVNSVRRFLQKKY